MPLTEYVVLNRNSEKEKVIAYDTSTTFPPKGAIVIDNDEKFSVVGHEVVIQDGRVDKVSVLLY